MYGAQGLHGCIGLPVSGFHGSGLADVQGSGLKKGFLKHTYLQGLETHENGPFD